VAEGSGACLEACRRVEGKNEIEIGKMMRDT